MSEKKDILAPIKEKLNPFFDKIGALSIAQRLLICVLTFAVITGGWYYFFYMPKKESLDQAQQTLKTKKKQLADYQKAASELLQYEKKMAATQAEFNLAMMALPDKRELPSLLTEISKAGSVVGLDFLLFKPEKEITEAFYKKIPVSIKVVGRYHQMTDFFFQITRLNRIVNIEDVKVAVQKGGLTLEMTCEAVTYMFVEKEEETPDKINKNNKNKRKKRKK
jgi:type IV pilus assembly protein PilO